MQTGLADKGDSIDGDGPNLAARAGHLSGMIKAKQVFLGIDLTLGEPVGPGNFCCDEEAKTVAHPLCAAPVTLEWLKHELDNDRRRPSQPPP